MHTTIDRSIRRQLAAIVLTVVPILIVAASIAAPAMGSAAEEQQGAQLLQNLQTGKTSCKVLKTNDFELIGEFVMGRMAGSTTAHDAMNSQITRSMGSDGERQAHVFMGKRFAGCATGAAPAALGPMIGMMGAGMMGTANGGGNYGMMRSPDGSGNFGTNGAWPAGRNGMMNGGNGHDDGWSGWGIAMVVLMGLLIAAIVGGLVAWGPWKRTPTQTPLEILKTRYARGEIDEQEFERLRQALGE
jgi:putative membrane protein